jgi:adenylate cyclase, class 2
MAHNGSNIETEIKLRVSGAAAARALLEKHGYRLIRPRILESNTLYDTPDYALRQRGELLRVRRAGDGGIVTFKAPEPPGRHKRRLELETQVGDAAVIETILERVGLAVSFRYEKYRAEYQLGSEEGVVTIDETPIGEFLELEGSPEWIDATARELGFSESGYILSSYGALYLEHCRRNKIEPGDMVFPG